jgi:hypothetical protein
MARLAGATFPDMLRARVEPDVHDNVCAATVGARASRLTSILAGNSFRAGKRTDPYLGWQHAPLLNWMPVISVLAGRSRAAGFQIAAQPYDDLSALSDRKRNAGDGGPCPSHELCDPT